MNNSETLYFNKLVNSVIEIIATRTEVPPPSKNSFILDKSLALGAKVSTATNRLPLISINRGTLIGLQDIMFSSCASDTFWTENIHSKNHVQQFDQSHFSFNDRFLNYEDLENDINDGNFESVYMAYPQTQLRKEQAALLSHSCSQWVMFHEVGHWLMGHCHLSQTQGINETTQHLFNVSNSSTSLSDNEHKVMELQADGFSYEILWYSLIAQQEPDSIWSSYYKNIGTPGDDLMDLMNIPERLRLCTTAAGTAILLFEKYRSENADYRSDKYPHPLTRLINIFASAVRLSFAYCNILIEHNNKMIISGDLYNKNKEFVDKVFAGIINSSIDLAQISKTLQISASINKANFDLEQNESMIADDVRVFLPELIALVSNEKVTTDFKGANKIAFDEYSNLQQYQEVLIEKLKDLALIEL